MDEHLTHYSLEERADRAFERLSEFLNGAGRRYSQRVEEANSLIGNDVRLAFINSLSQLGNQLPEEVPFQVDFGKAGGSVLIFNTREAQVYIRTPWQSYNVLLGLDGEEWFKYVGPIVEANPKGNAP